MSGTSLASEPETAARRLSPCAAPARIRAPGLRPRRALGRRIDRRGRRRAADDYAPDAARHGAHRDASGRAAASTPRPAGTAPASSSSTATTTAARGHAAATAARDDHLTRARQQDGHEGGAQRVSTPAANAIAATASRSSTRTHERDSDERDAHEVGAAHPSHGFAAASARLPRRCHAGADRPQAPVRRAGVRRARDPAARPGRGAR
jgi:hypothetical protein